MSGKSVRKGGRSRKLNIAAIGLGAMGSDNLRRCETENIVALCDVDWRLASTTFERYPSARKYRDYRRMLDNEKDLDAVIVATPDHTHAIITAEAMKQGKHVYTQMPLAHDVWEARQLAKIAHETGVTTQMGNERHSSKEIRRVCEWIWDGAIGPVRTVHCWTDRPTWPQGMNRPKGKSRAPSSLDWDLWLGPARERPYYRAYHPYNWRGWRDFGTGALGGMGCHVLDAPFWALRLDRASSFAVEATSTGANSQTYPLASVVRYRFPARGDMPPVTVKWYDGGLKPPRPRELPDTREHVGSSGNIFIGDEGTMAYGATTGAGPRSYASGPCLLPESRNRSYNRPRRTLPRVNGSHEAEWIRACKRGEQPCANFDYSAALTEMVLLGNVALLAGGRIEWDRERGKITNRRDADRFLRREYRTGWNLQQGDA